MRYRPVYLGIFMLAGTLTAQQDPAPAAPPDPHRALREVQKRLEQQGLDLRLEPRVLVISLPQTVLFASGDEHISQEALPMIGKIAEVLVDIPNRVSLIGHADSVPIHNRRFKNNWELSAARGLQLLEVLSVDDNIPESRLSVASDGSNRPKEPNDTPDGRASNRRVDITLDNVGQASQESVRQYPFNAADSLSLLQEERTKKTPTPTARKQVKLKLKVQR